MVPDTQAHDASHAANTAMIPETAGAARHLAEAALRCAGVVRLDDREIATYGVGLPVHGVSVTAEPDGKVVVRVAIVVEAGSNILDAAAWTYIAEAAMAVMQRVDFHLRDGLIGGRRQD